MIMNLLQCYLVGIVIVWIYTVFFTVSSCSCYFEYRIDYLNLYACCYS
jgi:hypothetical protein